ncbi:hypothetical protein [Duganella vulcania]|uniref:hypothetical protein n=1 Tax=Duganella vulcania TaxID=2692166 RepID=UPI00353175EC
MIILDTNAVSEPMKPSGSPAVQAWLDRHPAENLYLTATSLAELLVGIEIADLAVRSGCYGAYLCVTDGPRSRHWTHPVFG